MQTPAKVPPEYLRRLSRNTGVVTEPLTVSCHRKLYCLLDKPILLAVPSNIARLYDLYRFAQRAI